MKDLMKKIKPWHYVVGIVLIILILNKLLDLLLYASIIFTIFYTIKRVRTKKI